MRHEEEKGLDGESVRGNGLGRVQSMVELSMVLLIIIQWSSAEELLESVSGEAACESMHPSAEVSLVLDANNKWAVETQVGW